MRRKGLDNFLFFFFFKMDGFSPDFTDFIDPDFIDPVFINPFITDSAVFTEFSDLPVYTPDLENYVSPNCNFIDANNLYPYVSGLSLSILMLNIRSIKRNFNAFTAEFCN